MSRINLIVGAAKGLAKAARDPRARKLGVAALNQAKRLKAAAQGAKPIAKQVAKVKAQATGKPVRTTINTAARRNTLQRQAANAAKKAPSGDQKLYVDQRKLITTKGTKLAPGVTNSATKAPPVSRTTNPTKADQARQVKSALRDRGQAHVEASLPKSTKATANQARGNRYSASRNGSGPDPNYGNRSQPKSTTKNNKAQIEGDSRESARNFGRERVAAYNSGDPSARGRTARGTRARQQGAQQIIRDRVANETQGMNALERQNFRRGLVRQANEGERRVRAAAEQQAQGAARRDRFNRSPSAARQDHVPAPRDARRLSDGQRNKMAEDFGKLPKKPLPPSEAKPPVKRYETPADHTKGLQEVKKGFQQAPKAQPPAPPAPDKRGAADFSRSRLSQSGRVTTDTAPPAKTPNPTRYTTQNGDVSTVTKTTLKPQGEGTVPKSMEVSQRRAENLPKPGPQKPAEAAQKARQNTSDAALRQRNQAASAPRTNVAPNRSQGSTSGVAAAANRGVDRQGNNLQGINERNLRAIGWSR